MTVLGCEMFQPVCVTAEDKAKLTYESKREIATHNRFWAKACGNNKPPCEGL